MGKWLVAAVTLLCLGASLAAPLSSKQAPHVRGSKVLKLVFVYPDTALAGRQLYVRGSHLGLTWDRGQPLRKEDTDVWVLSLDFSDADIGALLEYKALIDDSTWQIGSNAMVVVPNDSAAASGVYPWFFAHTGSYQYVRNVYSPQLNNTRDLVVYVPPSYFENTLKIHKVLVMHDGQNLFNDSTSFIGVAWHCQDTVDELVNEGAMEEIVIVGVDNTAQRTYELTYSRDPSVGDGGGGDIYLNFLEQTVFPLVASRFRVSFGLPVGMLGSSLGGLISCYAGYTRSTYSRVGCMSSSFWWNSEDFNGVVLQHPSKAPNSSVFYLDSGNAGPDQDDLVQTHTVVEHMLALGFTQNASLFYYVDNGGQHSEVYWGRRFHVPMADLYPPLIVPTSTMP